MSAQLQDKLLSHLGDVALIGMSCFQPLQIPRISVFTCQYCGDEAPVPCELIY